MEHTHMPVPDHHREVELAGGSKPPGPPHEALFLAVAYLPLYELLSMGQVCRSLRDAVQHDDVLPWFDILVEKPLNTRFSDELLIKFASKANGRLRSLVLMNCSKITDNGILQVTEHNPGIQKLSVPGCTTLTPEGIIKAVTTLTKHNHNQKQIILRINGVYNINKHHLQTLHSLIQSNSSATQHQESDRSIDVDICPKCDEVRTVYDYPSGRRGCNLCIPRCQECGGCLEFGEIEEAACEDNLCSNCWLWLPKCDFCNKPYCSRHVDRRSYFPECLGFVCEVCYDRVC